MSVRLKINVFLFRQLSIFPSFSVLQRAVSGRAKARQPPKEL
jgi:hypothetical protein